MSTRSEYPDTVRLDWLEQQDPGMRAAIDKSMAEECAENVTCNASPPPLDRLQDLAPFNPNPVCWIRTKDGKFDWAEDCIGTSREDVIDGWKDYGETYDAVPLYLHPARLKPDQLHGVGTARDTPSANPQHGEKP